MDFRSGADAKRHGLRSAAAILLFEHRILASDGLFQWKFCDRRHVWGDRLSFNFDRCLPSPTQIHLFIRCLGLQEAWRRRGTRFSCRGFSDRVDLWNGHGKREMEPVARGQKSRPIRNFRLLFQWEQFGIGAAKMKNVSIENYVIELLTASFPDRRCGSITRDTDLAADLDADSMTMVSLVFSISEKAGISTDHLGDLLVNCRTAGDLISATEQQRREHA